MPKQTTTPTARRRIPAVRVSLPSRRRSPALPRRTSSKESRGFVRGLVGRGRPKEPQGFVRVLVSRVRPKRSAAKGKPGLSGTLGNAVTGLTSGASMKKIAQKPSAKSLVGLAAGAGVGAAALVKRRRGADRPVEEEESTVTVIETPASEPGREPTPSAEGKSPGRQP